MFAARDLSVLYIKMSNSKFPRIAYEYQNKLIWCKNVIFPVKMTETKILFFTSLTTNSLKFINVPLKF